jgi:hypothetical protein
MLKEFVLSKKTARYFYPYHPFGCLVVFTAEGTEHTLAVFVLVHVDPHKLVLPGLIESAVTMLGLLLGWLRISFFVDWLFFSITTR